MHRYDVPSIFDQENQHQDGDVWVLQVTQNGSDLWLSYWVSHTHEERIEGALLETAWRNATAAPDATGDWQQHMPWLWLSMAGVQPAGGQVSQCCLWAQSGLSGGGVEHEGNSNSIGSSSVKRMLVAVETEPWGDEEGHLDQQQVTHNAEADQSARGSVVMEEGLRGGLGVRKAAGVAYSAQAAGGGGSLQEPGLRQQWQRLAGAAWRLWARQKRLLRELRPDVQLYLSVLLLLAAANSLFILVRSHAAAPSGPYPHTVICMKPWAAAPCADSLPACRSD